MNRGAGNAAVIDVADDGNMQAFQYLLMPQNGICIEQRLRRMLVHAISRVDDGNIQMLCHQQRCASIRMPNDDYIRSHRAQRVTSVEQ